MFGGWEYLFDDEKRVKVSFLKILLNYNLFIQLFWNERKGKEIAKQRAIAEKRMKELWKEMKEEWGRMMVKEKWMNWRSTSVSKYILFEDTPFHQERKKKKKRDEERRKKNEEEYSQMLELLMNKWWKEWDERRKMKIASRNKFSWERLVNVFFLPNFLVAKKCESSSSHLLPSFWSEMTERERKVRWSIKYSSNKSHLPLATVCKSSSLFGTRRIESSRAGIFRDWNLPR